MRRILVILLPCLFLLAPAGASTSSYADGVGLVHWEMSCAFCSYSLEPVVIDTGTGTWSHLKALYRGSAD